MGVQLQILSDILLTDFSDAVSADVVEVLHKNKETQVGVDYFEFYNAVSSVYSSKIEGEDIDFDSFYKFKFNGQKYKTDYTKRTEDVYKAYSYIQSNDLSFDSLMKAHTILTKHLLPKSERGKIRQNAMFVLDADDKIAYVAADVSIVEKETKKLFNDIEVLCETNLELAEVFYYAAMIHLVFVKIHPLQDGNGRTARLLEKWFLVTKLGEVAHAINLEKNYYKNVNDYYLNLKALGNQYEIVDYAKCLPLLRMTLSSITATNN